VEVVEIAALASQSEGWESCYGLAGETVDVSSGPDSSRACRQQLLRPYLVAWANLNEPPLCSYMDILDLAGRS
jgi:hypothetical protein